MSRNALVLIVVALAVGLMLYTGSRMQSSTSAPTDPATPARLSGNVKGLQAPDFELQRLDGTTFKLSSLRGKAVVLNFWATYCGPCKIEMPWLTEFQNQYGPQGVEVIGVAMDPDSGRVPEFVKEVGAEYTILLGTEAVGDAYGGVQFLPATFYIDREGKVVDRVFGLVSRSEIEDNIKLSLGPVAGPGAASTVPAAESHEHHAPETHPAPETAPGTKK